MSKISSNIRGLEEQVDRLKDSAVRVNNIYSQFNAVKNSIDYVISQRHNIKYQLDTASRGIKSLGERLDNSGIHINSAINSYLDAEQRLESLVAVLEAPQKKQEQSNNIFDEPAREVYTEDSIRRFSTSSYMKDNIPYHDMMDIIKQIDEQMKISNNQLNEWSSAKYIADANIKELFRKLKELDTGEITTGVAEGGYDETGVWEHYKKYIKENELLYKEKTGQTITPYDIYEFARLSAMADLIDVYGDSVYITKNEHLIQSKIAESLGVNVQILENNDILFIDKNVIWKYVGEDTYEASCNLVHGGYGARSVEALKKLNESSSATALGHAVQNRSLDLTVEDLQFLYSMDPYGAKEYVTGIPGYTQKEKEYKKELREELYKLLTGEEIQYYKHKWSNWEKTDNPEGDIWGTVKSNADFALEVNDGIPDDLLSVVKPITYTAAAFYGLNTLGVFLEGVSIYGFRMASGLAANGMLKEMIADYNSTLGATDADEQFIINALNSTDKDEELLEGTTKLNYNPTSGTKLVATPGKTSTVLGRYGDDIQYVIKELKLKKTLDYSGNPGGFNVLNVPDELYVNPQQFWDEFNAPFLDKAISRGDVIIMATEPVGSALRDAITGQLTGFGREFEYLKNAGYIYDSIKKVMRLP
ncbi:hypothetical protein [Vallitalea guaymasensis]|uniref:hypothetical protein n=1 Tax=Vallitalea guaymasensis TaxID=1185412 RepID=UPI00235217D6|nr:hypothetical protein [Vallitalea guaymasensis]